MNKVDIKNDFYFMKEVALDFDDGWDNLIYDLCKELNEITPISLRNKFIVLQVKEKFGTLRFYVSYANKKMLDAIDIFPGIQAMYQAIGHFPKVGKFDLTSIKAAISGAGPLTHDVQDRFEHLTEARIVEGYGLSEASPVTHANPIFGRRKTGTIGLPWPDTDARIVDLETGTREQPVGEAGKLVVRGPQVMSGYWNKPEETAQALRGGWLHTGDIAKRDEEGYFFIVDRIKDMIKTVGENVYPREVEGVLYTHPKVKEAVVVGVPHEEFMGEKIKAYIVPKDGMGATPEEIMDFCKAELSKFKCPKEVEFRDQLPKTLVGKVLRRVLRDEERKKLGIKEKI